MIPPPSIVSIVLANKFGLIASKSYKRIKQKRMVKLMMVADDLQHMTKHTPEKYKAAKHTVTKEDKVLCSEIYNDLQNVQCKKPIIIDTEMNMPIPIT